MRRRWKLARAARLVATIVIGLRYLALLFRARNNTSWLSARSVRGYWSR